MLDINQMKFGDITSSIVFKYIDKNIETTKYEIVFMRNISLFLTFLIKWMSISVKTYKIAREIRMDSRRPINWKIAIKDIKDNSIYKMK